MYIVHCLNSIIGSLFITIYFCFTTHTVQFKIKGTKTKTLCSTQGQQFVLCSGFVKCV